MNNDLLRYSCQLPLEGFGAKSQEKLKTARVLIVGLGGLGCPVSQYLAAVGIGTLGIADYDTVSAKNLHRQVLYIEQDIGKSKVAVAASRLHEQNASVTINSYSEKITDKNITEVIKPYDIVVDCTDNFATRYLVNDACVLNHKPLVYGAIFQYEGQVAVWNVKNSAGTFSPNFRDIFPSADDLTNPNCEISGVFPTIAGIIGCVQASEVIKLITGIGDLLTSRLFLFDAKAMNSRVVTLPKTATTQISDLKTEEKIPVISPKDLKDALETKSYSLIDVRSKIEHEKVNIGGENIPLNEFLETRSQFNFDKPVVFYCASGVRSAAAVKHVLRIKPDAKVASLDGGLQAWSNE